MPNCDGDGVLHDTLAQLAAGNTLSRIEDDPVISSYYPEPKRYGWWCFCSHITWSLLKYFFGLKIIQVQACICPLQDWQKCSQPSVRSSRSTPDPFRVRQANPTLSGWRAGQCRDQHVNPFHGTCRRKQKASGFHTKVQTKIAVDAADFGLTNATPFSNHVKHLRFFNAN